MPSIEVITLNPPSVFAEESLPRKVNALIGGRLEIPHSESRALQERAEPYDVTPEGFKGGLKLEVLVLNSKGNSIVRCVFLDSSNVTNVTRMPEERNAMVISEDAGEGTSRVHAFIIHKP